MPGGLDRIEGMSDREIWVEDEGGSNDANDFATVVHLFSVGTPSGHDTLAGVREKIEPQMKAFSKVQVTLDGVGRDADELNVELPQPITHLIEVGCLKGTSGRHVLGVEVDDTDLASE